MIRIVGESFPGSSATVRYEWPDAEPATMFRFVPAFALGFAFGAIAALALTVALAARPDSAQAARPAGAAGANGAMATPN